MRYDGAKQDTRCVYGKTEGEAAAKKAVLLRQLADNKLPAPGRMTVTQHLTAWLAHKKASGWGDGTLEINTYYVEKYLAPRVGRLQLKKLTPLHVSKLQASLAEEVSPPPPRRPALS